MGDGFYDDRLERAVEDVLHRTTIAFPQAAILTHGRRERSRPRSSRGLRGEQVWRGSHPSRRRAEDIVRLY